MTFYAELASVAHELLTQFGMPMTLARPSTSAPTYDPATGAATVVSPTSYAVTGAKFDYTAREIDGTLVLAGDQRVYLSTTGAILPAPGDTLTIGGAVWRVMRAGALSPAGSDVLYDVQVRQ